MFSRLFSSSRRNVPTDATTTTTTTTVTTTTTTDNVTPTSVIGAVKPANEVYNNAKSRMSPSSLTEPGSIATNSHTNTVPDSPSRGGGAGLRTPSPSHDSAGVDAESLKELFKSCPPKIVYSYLTSQIVNASPGELHMLSSFFSELQPPSRLHCVRCHKSYFEVDNDDRSCTMPHDDESAEVEHVKGGGFETRWDCCGRTVEGSGELGPPNGWCYEGRHTVDLKRARYRNDSSLAEDKLVSCVKKKCFARLQPKEEKRPPPSRGGAASGGKPRSVYIPDDARSVRSTRSTRSLGREAEASAAVAAIMKPISTKSSSASKAAVLAAALSSPTRPSVSRKRKRPMKKDDSDDDNDGEEEEEEVEEKEKENEGRKVKESAVKSKPRASTTNITTTTGTRARSGPKAKDKEKDQTDDDAKSVKSVRSVRATTPAPKKKRRKSVVE